MDLLEGKCLTWRGAGLFFARISWRKMKGNAKDGRVLEILSGRTRTIIQHLCHMGKKFSIIDFLDIFNFPYAC